MNPTKEVRSPTTGAKKRVRFASCSASSSPTLSTTNDDLSTPVQVTQLGPLLPHYSEFTQEHRQELWWSETELHHIQRSAKLLARGIRQRSHNKRNKSSSYANVVRQIHHDCATTGVPTTKTMHLLEQWNMAGHSRRGIEVLSVPMDERRASELVTEHVLQAQHYLRQQQRGMSEEQQSDLLRQASLFYSQTSELFASTMAQADAMAALDEHQSQPVFAELMQLCGDNVLSSLNATNEVEAAKCSAATTTTTEEEQTTTPSHKKLLSFANIKSRKSNNNNKTVRRYQVRSRRKTSRHYAGQDNEDCPNAPRFLWA